MSDAKEPVVGGIVAFGDEDGVSDDDRNIWQRINDTEPALVRGFAGAALVLAVAFGAPISDAQQNAVLGFVAAIMMLLVSLSTRQSVYPQASVDEIASDAYLAGHEDAIEAHFRPTDPGTPV